MVLAVFRPEGSGAAAKSTAGTRFVRIAPMAALVLLVAQSAAHLIATLGFGWLGSPVDLDRNNGIPDVISTLLILSVALGAFKLSVRSKSRGGAALAVGLGVVSVIIAIDDLFQQDNLDSAYGDVVVVTLIAAGLLVVAVAMTAPRTARISMLIGVALLAVDVKVPFAYDQLMNAIGDPALRRGDVLYELGIVLDEAAETTGWILLAIGMWLTVRASPQRAPQAASAPDV